MKKIISFFRKFFTKEPPKIDHTKNLDYGGYESPFPTNGKGYMGGN